MLGKHSTNLATPPAEDRYICWAVFNKFWMGWVTHCQCPWLYLFGGSMPTGDRLYLVLGLGVTSPSFIPFHLAQGSHTPVGKQCNWISSNTQQSPRWPRGPDVVKTGILWQWQRSSTHNNAGSSGLVLTFTYFMCIIVFACMYVHHVYVWCPWRSEVGTGCS